MTQPLETINQSALDMSLEVANVLLPVGSDGYISALNGKLFASAIKNEVGEELYEKIHQLGSIKGKKVGRGLIRLDGVQYVPLRCSIDVCGQFFALASKTLGIGQAQIQIGVPIISPLQPKPNLKAYMVLFRSEKDGSFCDKPDSFCAKLNTKLTELGIESRPEEISENDAKILKMSDKKIKNGQTQDLILRGFPVTFSNLTPTESVILQAAGLGSHKRFGCGVFV